MRTKAQQSSRWKLLLAIAFTIFIGQAFVFNNFANFPMLRNVMASLSMQHYPEPNSDEEVDALRAIAENGSARDKLILADRYYVRGQKNPAQMSDAFYWTKRAADEGDIRAMHSLGIHYLHGSGTPKNPAAACEWFAKGANSKVIENGVLQCMGALADCYYRGDVTNKVDYENAMMWYQKAAAAGNDNALVEMAKMHYYGHGVPKNIEKAEALYAQAATKSPRGNEYEIALHYLRMTKTKDKLEAAEDIQKAIVWLNKAAQYGKEDALIRLVDLYYAGKDVPKDEKLAFEYAQQAANRGNAKAQAKLAIFYRDGAGTSRNISKALSWAKRSAEQGWPFGQLMYGHLLAKYKKDYNAGYPWVKLAANSNDQEAKEWLGRLQSKMSQAEYEAGENAAEKFVAKKEPFLPYAY